MSRIGQQILKIPSGVTISQENNLLTVTGPKGTLSQIVPEYVTVTIDGDTVRVSANNNNRKTRALHGLIRQLTNNMLTGTSTGFTKVLEMKGTGYRAQLEGTTLVLSVGYSHPVRIEAPEGITFKVEKNVIISVEGINRELVGETSAKIRAIRKPEPYKGKGIRYQGEVVRLKPGKAAKSASA